MQSSERGIDHIVLAVKDLEAARRRFASLGFTCTPPARHPFGTGNSLLQFANSFVELVTVVAPEKLVPMSQDHYSFSAKTAQFLEERGEGMAMLVMSSQDARGDNAAWAARGLKTYEAVDFSRQAGQPGGGTALVSFTIAFAIDPTMPEVAFFVCQQHAPENFWQPAYQVHENGVTDILSVTLSAPAPESRRDFFATYLPEAEIEAGEDRLIVEAPRGRIEVLRPEDVEARFGPDETRATGDLPSFVAMTLGVRDLE
ncbi:MAG TPA: VOC family protein, partial [Kiloniellaceae bacterium]|nr:VOC family protein [Kiloniellaceae bacterium]